MEIYTISSASFASNCYLIISEDSNGSRRAAIIDPGADAHEIIRMSEEKNAVIELIVLTHGHFDHITSLDELRYLTLAPAYIHKDDAEMLSDGRKNAYSLFYGYDKKWREAERLLENGDIISLGKETIKVISTPGHSRGSICLLCGDKLITGDTLFANGYGRYDLYGGDVNELTASLSSLRALDGKLTIYPGHGGSALLSDALDNIIYY